MRVYLVRYRPKLLLPVGVAIIVVVIVVQVTSRTCIVIAILLQNRPKWKFNILTVLLSTVTPKLQITWNSMLLWLSFNAIDLYDSHVYSYSHCLVWKV